MELEDKRRPLFGELTEDLEREDAWCEPKGFVIGGWMPSGEDFAQQYFDAADVLVESILKNQREGYRLAYPALFLYRHSLELLLKEVVDSPAWGHTSAN